MRPQLVNVLGLAVSPPPPSSGSQTTYNVIEVVWRGTGSTRSGGTDARWQRQIAYDAAEKHHFRTVLNKLPRKPERTQLAQAGGLVFSRAHCQKNSLPLP